MNTPLQSVTRRRMSRICFLAALAIFAAGVLPTRAAFAEEIAVIVNPANSISTLSPEDLARLFLGRATTFPNGQRAIPVNQAPASTVRVAFDQALLGKSQSQIRAFWATQMFSGAGVPPAEAPDDAAVLARVSADANAIGYVAASKVTGDVKVVLKK
jgi:ABC-type phosphate transport system substrate-binding protein